MWRKKTIKIIAQKGFCAFAEWTQRIFFFLTQFLPQTDSSHNHGNKSKGLKQHVNEKHSVAY